eukprot:2984191-Ditylum_brightwellii.AAC.1
MSDKDNKRATEAISVDDDGAYVAAAIYSGQAIAISNGSHNKGRSGTAFVIEEGTYSVHCILGNCTTPGSLDDHDTYSGKLSGLYLIPSSVHYLCSQYSIDKVLINVACNDIDTLKKSLDKDTSFECRSSHFSLISAICNFVKQNPLT